MNSLRLVLVVVLALFCILPSGCASFHEDLRDVGRGVPISVDDIPEGVIVLFHRVYCSSPSCTPSRAAFLSGQDFFHFKETSCLWSHVGRHVSSRTLTVAVVTALK